MDEFDPKYLDGISELFIFMFLFILFFDNCIIIDGILLLFIMMGDPFSVNFYDMMYTLHLFIFSLPPDVNWRCCHV